MNFLQNTFFAELTRQTFPGNALIQECVFKYRFSPDYKKYPHSSSANELKGIEPNIADLVAKELNGRPGDYSSSIAMQISAGISKLYKTYKEEMRKDEIEESQLKGKQGQSSNSTDSPWQIAYRWIWEVQYPRWQQDYLWNDWKEKAQINLDWMEFSDRTLDYAHRGLVIPKPASKASIPINTPLNLEINIDSPDSYLYLFNRGVDAQDNTTRYLIAPSQAFAPNCYLADKITLMPQQGAICEEVGIQFDAEGKEEYLGIVVDKPLELRWLNPDPENPALEWQGTHLGEVWEQLQDKNWQVFYRDFEVVSPKVKVA